MVDTTNRIQTILTAQDESQAAFQRAAANVKKLEGAFADLGRQGRAHLQKLQLDERITAGMSRAAAAVRKSSADINTSLGSITTTGQRVLAFFGVFASTVGVGLFARSIVRNIGDTAAELNKLKKQIGISIEDLSRLRFASRQLDTEFSAVATGIARLSKSMFAAATEGGQLAELFSDLGVELRDESGLRAPLDAFLDLADAINKVEDPAARLAIAQKMLGRGAAELLPLLEGGSAAIKKFTDESDRLGATLSTQTVRAIDDLKDNTAALKDSLLGLTAVKLGPFAADLADVTKAAITLGASNKEGAKSASVFLDTISPARLAVRAASKAFHELAEAVRGSGDQIQTSFGPTNARGRAVQDFAKFITEDTDKIIAAFKRQADAFKAANDELAKTVERRNELAQSFRDLLADINKPGPTAATGTVLEPIRTIDTARDALQNKQDAEEAIRLAEQAREQLAALAKEGTVSKSFLTSLAKQAAEIADRAALAQQDKVVDKIEETKVRLKALADIAQIKIDLNAVDVQAQLANLQQQLQQSANERPIVIPAVLGRALSAPADQIPALMGKADGGLIPGVGGPRSDSVLARLSPGEFVMSAAAVGRMGLPFMDAVNRMRVPRFADGGPVASASGGASTQFNVFLPGQAPVTLFSNDDVIGLFKGVIGRQAVKSGRRLR